MFFKLGMMIETTGVYTFHSSFNDLDLHSRSEVYEKAKASARMLRVSDQNGVSRLYISM